MCTLSPENQKLYDLLLVRGEVEFCYSNGPFISRKTITKLDEDFFRIDHHIDDTSNFFSLKGIKEVLADERIAWDGDMDETGVQ